MIFGGEHNNYQERYHTRTEALMGHKRAFEMVRASVAAETEDKTRPNLTGNES